MRQPSALQLGIPLFCAAIGLASTAVPAKRASATQPGRLPTLWALQDDARISPPEPTQRDFSADLEERESYLIQGLEIVGFDALLNLANRNFNGDPFRGSRMEVMAFLVKNPRRRDAPERSAGQIARCDTGAETRRWVRRHLVSHDYNERSP